ncbi:MAG: hypothetical protein JWM95_5334 [Gemmatimonadetes bacterium]|nr:hypothetical protein [Gemmatimonadota bacterium]
MIGALLLFVIVAISSAAWLEMRRTSLAAASARLVSVTTQLRDAFQQSGAQLKSAGAALANRPAVAAFLRAPSPALHDSVVAVLAPAGPQADQVLRTELRNKAGTVLASVGAPDAGLDSLSVMALAPVLAKGDSLSLGIMRILRDTVVFSLTARVPNAGGAFVVQWRRLTSTRRARQQLEQLVGSDASLFVGNADYSVLTDLERPIPTPAVDRATRNAAQQYTAVGSGDRYLFDGAPIAGTPWATAVQVPLNTVFAPVNAFLRKLAIIALVALALGLIAAWMASRRITRPLIQLTTAANAIARGEATDAVRLTRFDELGQLAAAFAVMAEEVENARGALELKVDERTVELHRTMQQLHDAQDSLVRREKLAMLGQLASGVGHELRNPLGVMTNAVYYLKLVLKASPQNVQEYLDILQQQITLSEKIVGDLLDFARLRPPQREAASLKAVTQAQILRLGSPEGIEIDEQVSAELPSVLVDQVQMGQIILNMLTNAMQAMDGQGRISISAASEEGRVILDVADTGSGILPENMEKIFEPLFTTKARGIGLGLAVSRTLARANGGELSASSVHGKGATFRLTLETAARAAA